MNQIFEYGGGAGICSYVIVIKDGVLDPATDARRIKGSYENGESLFVSIIDTDTAAALLPLEGYVDPQSGLHLFGRDFDDNKTYKILVDKNYNVSYIVVDGIDLNGFTLEERFNEKLISGVNLKTINGNSLLGQGDIAAIGPKGDKGDPGPAGPTGAAGAAGEKGEKGDIGPTGAKGDKGDTGQGFSIYKTYGSIAEMEADLDNVPVGRFVMISSHPGDPDNAKLYVRGEYSFNFVADLSGAQGIVGPTGATGPQGQKGDKGENGPIGPTGNEGAVGPTGPQGEKGAAFKYTDFTPEQLESLRGPTGLQGPAGEAGVMGPTGETGGVGPTGSQGIQGPTGAKGDKGDAFKYTDFTPEQLAALKGPTGAKGDNGSVGPTGAQGIQGERGEQGPEGNLGPTGPQGGIGPKGDQGDPGLTGPTGARGTDGLTTKIQVNGNTYEQVGGLITLPNYSDITMGQSFTTNVTVGHLDSGTEIPSTMTVQEVLYKILYKDPEPVTKIVIYLGGAGDGDEYIEPQASDLTSLEKLEFNDDTSIVGQHRWTIKSGIESRQVGQYPTFAVPKGYKVTAWSADEAGSFPYYPTKVEATTHNMYYSENATYDLPAGNPDNYITVVKES